METRKLVKSYFQLNFQYKLEKCADKTLDMT